MFRIWWRSVQNWAHNLGRNRRVDGHRTDGRTLDGHRTLKWFYILSNAVYCIGQTKMTCVRSRSMNKFEKCCNTLFCPKTQRWDRCIFNKKYAWRNVWYIISLQPSPRKTDSVRCQRTTYRKPHTTSPMVTWRRDWWPHMTPKKVEVMIQNLWSLITITMPVLYFCLAYSLFVCFFYIFLYTFIILFELVTIGGQHWWASAPLAACHIFIIFCIVLFIFCFGNK